jgi:hypothetical protein
VPGAAVAIATAVAPAPPAAPLPKRPSPSAVRTSFRSIQPAMRACAGGRAGMVTLRASIAGDGRLASGSVEADFANPDERSCMTRALLELRFPPFEQSTFDITYPMAL